MQRLKVSGAVRPLYGSLGVKGLSKESYYEELVRHSSLTAYKRFCLYFLGFYAYLKCCLEGKMTLNGP